MLLNATKREQKREPNKIPGVLYGPEIKENILINIDKKELIKLIQEIGESALFDLKLDNKTYPVLIHGYQTEQMTCEITHIDFYSPILSKEVEAEVPIEFLGEAGAVSLGGNLIHNLQILHIKALPDKIPQKIEVDLSVLETFEDRILVKDIKAPKDITILEEENDVVAHVVEQPKQAVEKPKEEEKPQEEENKNEEK
jgi:large subunit ribosomal protein L25